MLGGALTFAAQRASRRRRPETTTQRPRSGSLNSATMRALVLILFGTRCSATSWRGRTRGRQKLTRQHTGLGLTEHRTGSVSVISSIPKTRLGELCSRAACPRMPFLGRATPRTAAAAGPRRTRVDAGRVSCARARAPAPPPTSRPPPPTSRPAPRARSRTAARNAR